MLAEFEGAPNIMHVAPGGGPVTPHDGTSWSTAYSTIGEALAPNGTRSNVVVLVAPGTYTGSFEVKGSNVSIVGAGACTRIEYTSPPPNADVSGLPVVFIWASNVTFEDLQIVNLRPDAGGQFANAISLQYPGGAPIFQSNLVIRQCFMHGEATLWLHQYEGVFLLDAVLSGYENAIVAGAVTPFSPEYSTIASFGILRIEPMVDRNAPSIHATRGVVTAANCSISSVGMANGLTQGGYRGVLSAASNCNFWACTIGANAKPLVSNSGALFQGIFAQDNSLVNVAGSVVRAVGPTNYAAVLVEVAGSKIEPPATDSTSTLQWTLANTVKL